MGKLTVIIPDELEKRFRIEIIKHYNGKRGTLTKAVINAITYLLNLWIEPMQWSNMEIKEKIKSMPHRDRLKLKKDLRSLYYTYIENEYLNHADVIELVVQALNVEKGAGKSAFDGFIDHNIKA